MDVVKAVKTRKAGSAVEKLDTVGLADCTRHAPSKAACDHSFGHLHAASRKHQPRGNHGFGLLCQTPSNEHRLTRRGTPGTNGMVECFMDALPCAQVNRPGNELTPRSWTNFKGCHEEVPNRFQAQGGQELFGWRRRSEAAGAAVVCA